MESVRTGSYLSHTWRGLCRDTFSMDGNFIPAPVGQVMLRRQKKFPRELFVLPMESSGIRIPILLSARKMDFYLPEPGGIFMPFAHNLRSVLLPVSSFSTRSKINGKVSI